MGLVGLPNAGKSTLLAALTNATPKIASYPFTTLEPNLGVMDLGVEDGRLPTIADVPGLIEGASAGLGLGHAFLRHVERTRILLHVVDGAAKDPGWDHAVIRDELEAHDPALLQKPMLVVFNKLDLAAAREAWPAFRASLDAAGTGVVAISADEGEGLDELRAAVADLLPDLEGLEAPPDPAGVVVHRLEAAGDGYTIEREDGGVPRPRQARRAAHEPDELRERGVGRAVPARAPPDGDRRGTAEGGHPRGRPGPDRRVRAGVGAAGGRRVTSAPVAIAPPAPVVPGSVGIFGGTFDPIHHGHLAIAEEAREALGLEVVRFVPAAVSPFKPDRPVTDAGHRLAMVEAAIAGNPAFEASRVELDRPGPSYTVETLEAGRGSGRHRRLAHRVVGGAGGVPALA